jgi:NADH:ubiquinone reductase (H+-translocating)
VLKHEHGALVGAEEPEGVSDVDGGLRIAVIRDSLQLVLVDRLDPTGSRGAEGLADRNAARPASQRSWFSERSDMGHDGDHRLLERVVAALQCDGTAHPAQVGQERPDQCIQRPRIPALRITDHLCADVVTSLRGHRNPKGSRELSCWFRPLLHVGWSRKEIPEMGDDRDEKQVVVLGAGYTGLMAALRVARRTHRSDTRVVLVNPSPVFVERLRMHQIAAGQTLATISIPDMLEGTNVEFVEGWARSIDPEVGRVSVEQVGGMRQLSFDYLVHAIGSTVNTATVPGVDVHAFTLDNPTQAQRMAERLCSLPANSSVAVCGNGLTGVEAAAEIAESHPHLHVVLVGRTEPASMMGVKARQHLLSTMERLGVELRSGAAVTKVLPDAVELDSGETLAADACLWTTGFWCSPLAGDAGLAVDDRGRVIVDDSLRSISHPAVYAVGDSAAVRQPWGELHGTCQSGLPTAIWAADAIAREIAGKTPKRFRFGYIHQPVSLGRHDGVIQFAKPNDTPRRGYLKGKRAVRYKETVSASPPKLYRLSRRHVLPKALLVPKGGRATRKTPSDPARVNPVGTLGLPSRTSR